MIARVERYEARRVDRIILSVGDEMADDVVIEITDRARASLPDGGLREVLYELITQPLNRDLVGL